MGDMPTSLNPAKSASWSVSPGPCVDHFLSFLQVLQVKRKHTFVVDVDGQVVEYDAPPHTGHAALCMSSARHTLLRRDACGMSNLAAAGQENGGGGHDCLMVVSWYSPASVSW